MKYALIDSQKTEARPGLAAVCACCGSAVVSKCGRIKIWHWAHKSKLNCDPWWENESEWHRNWKGQFDKAYQEVVFHDELTFEKHIADIRAPKGEVIEFQSYQLKAEELDSREAFYKKMVWVVNGLKSDFDQYYFNSGLSRSTSDGDTWDLIWFARSKLMERWAAAKCPVYFDFGNEVLWRLVTFNISGKRGKVRPISKQDFIESFSGDPDLEVL